jgi:hypothetical protein
MFLSPATSVVIRSLWTHTYTVTTNVTHTQWCCIYLWVLFDGRACKADKYIVRRLQFIRGSYLWFGASFSYLTTTPCIPNPRHHDHFQLYLAYNRSIYITKLTGNSKYKLYGFLQENFVSYFNYTYSIAIMTTKLILSYVFLIIINQQYENNIHDLRYLLLLSFLRL